jgi:hypothetical protein
VLTDSLNYSSYNLETGQKELKKYSFVSDESFTIFRSAYTPVYENYKDILFIDNGCGRVYQWRNDSIIRIDRSFHHKNQFHNSTFYHNGKVFLYGGYGFFQAKNIITTYDKVLNEWFLYDVGGKKPFVTPYYYSSYEEGVLTVFNFKEANSQIASVYQIDIKDKRWKYFGDIKAPSPSIVLNNVVSLRNLDYLILDKLLARWDIKSHSFNYFKLPVAFQLKYIKVIGNNILVLGATSQENPYYFLIYKKAEFVFPKVKSEQLINSGGSNSPWLISGGIGFIIGLLVLIGWRFKRSKKRKVELSFTKPVFEVLNYWITNENFQIELSELNDFVDYDNPSMETLKKRREMLLKCIKLELQDQFPNIGKDPFEISSHHQDRRIKVLTLNRFISDQLVKGGIREK